MKAKAGDTVIFVNDCSTTDFPQYEGKILKYRHSPSFSTKMRASKLIGSSIRWAWGWKNPPAPEVAYKRMLPPTKAALAKTDGKTVCSLTLQKGFKKVSSGTSAKVIEVTKDKVFFPYRSGWSCANLLILELEDGRKVLSEAKYVHKTDPNNPRCVSFLSSGPRVALYEAVINNKGNRIWKRLCFLSRRFDRGKEDRYEIMFAVEHYAKKLGLPALIVTRGTPYDEKENETWLKIGYQPPTLDEGALVTFRIAATMNEDKSEIIFFGSDVWRKRVYPKPQQAELPIQPGEKEAIVLGYLDDPELGRGARVRVLYQGRSYDVYRDRLRVLDGS